MHGIQRGLNAIRCDMERVDDETKWAAPELMLGTSNSMVALATKNGKARHKIVTRTVAVPKMQIVKQEPQQATRKEKERTEIIPICL